MPLKTDFRPPLLVGKGGSASVGSLYIFPDITPDRHPVDPIMEDVTKKIIKQNLTSIIRKMKAEFEITHFSVVTEKFSSGEDFCQK